MKDDKELIFPLGEKLASPNFKGEAWLKMLVGDEKPYECPIGNVTFAPGARNSWHTHSGGQILLVISGRGYYQEKGRLARQLKAGDTVLIPADVEHWHGAAADSRFSHLSITPNAADNEPTWLQPVTDEEYAETNKTK